MYSVGARTRFAVPLSRWREKDKEREREREGGRKRERERELRIKKYNYLRVNSDRKSNNALPDNAIKKA